MRMRCLLLLSGGLFAALSALGVIAAPLHAGSASLLLDINPDEAFQDELNIQSPFLSLGTSALVAIDEPGSGREIWVTDGTEQGTRPLLDLCPAGCSSFFTPLAALGPVGIFTAYPEADGEPRLWRSDGTRLGTVPLSPGGESLRSCSASTATIGSQLLFAARLSVESECGLWRTDGTVAGTVRVREISPGAITAAGGRAFFVTYVRPAWQLWRSDGTPGGTILLSEWQTGSPNTLVAAGSRLFFLAQEDGRELWTSDGTPAGTRRLTQFAAAEPFVGRFDSLSGFVLQDAGGSACFLANPTGTERELWCSDGTAAGTRPVTSLALASPFLGLASWSVERMGGGRFLFPASDGSGNRWWTSDGQPGSTAPLTGCPGGCPVLETGAPRVRLGALVFFTALGTGPSDPEEPPTTDLWVTDGTGAGTRRVGNFCETCRVDGLTSLLGRVVFATGRDRDPFTEDLWISDGTPQGTRVLARFGNDIFRPGLPYPAAVLRGRALFTIGERDRLDGGKGLWVSDATPEETGVLEVLGSNGLGSQPKELVPTPDGVRFLAGSLWSSQGTAATTQPIPTDRGIESLTAFGALTLFQERGQGLGSAGLGRTDGTAAGTFTLTPEGLEVERPVVLGNNRAVFLAREDGDPTFSLWRTDGTVAGTQEVAVLPEDVASLVPAGASALIVMFSSPDDILWRTDGTAAGTREIPLPAEFRSYDRGDVAQLGSSLFFRGFSLEGGQLWRSDGTPGGTRPLAPNLLGSPGSLTVHAGALYVLAHTKGTGSVQNGLFRSDGTDAGTVLLATVPRSTTGEPDFAYFTSVGNLLFFVLDDEQRGRELWRTDGTPAGTFLVRDIVPGPISSQPRSLAALNGRLYFAAPSSVYGTELWESDGTEAGTRPVQDIWPGAFSSEPEELVAGGGKLFFSADDGVHGREPWVYTPGGAGCAPSENALCLGGRFRVEADWRTGEEESGRGRAVALTADTGYFWFFDPSNVEVILKVLDGQGVNGHHWVFYGALSNVEYALTVTDTQTGAARRYVNPPGRLASVGDTRAFGPLGASAAGVVTQGPAPEPVLEDAHVTTRRIKATGTCAPSSTRLCLNGGRFAVEVRWKDFQGNTGRGQADSLTGDTGTFWFFDESNVEVVLKVLDGRPLNGKFWVFYGALSSVEYALTITDTETGVVKTYTNPSGRLASVADTEAF